MGKRSGPPTSRRALRTAMVLGMRQREQASRGTRVGSASRAATRRAEELPISERAGAPLVKTEVRPEDWRTCDGKELAVDLARAPWLPDDWGQAVKMTKPISRSRAGYGGTYTVWISPQGRVFYHRPTIEQHLGRKLGPRDGFRGQLRLMQLQGKQTDESKFFKLLTRKERAALPAARELLFCVISARRASTPEGMADIATVQAQFEKAGVQPTWYVDRASLKDYRRLGLRAVVGGGLTEARNRALNDAERQRVACVQISDDISRWEYHDGVQTKVRSDEAANAAHAAATCHVVSPVAAARFLLAKMRGTENGKCRPRLAGVYPLGSCARSFNGAPFSSHHFILGDFFVADRSPVRFDPSMSLKEDYDYTCAHIARHGSVLRCNRMTVQAKHQTNSGGACSNRDRKGREEQRNIAILLRKWPRAFRMNPKRRNEVILQWPEANKASGSQAVFKHSVKSSKHHAKHFGTVPADLRKQAEKVVARWRQTREAQHRSPYELEPPAHWPAGALPDPSCSRAWWLPHGWTPAVQVTAGGRLRRCFIGPEGVRKFHKCDVEAAAANAPRPPGRPPLVPPWRLPPDAVLMRGAAPRTPYIQQRCEAAAGKTVRAALAAVRYIDSVGREKTYGAGDLCHDIHNGFLSFAKP